LFDLSLKKKAKCNLKLSPCFAVPSFFAWVLLRHS